MLKSNNKRDRFLVEYGELNEQEIVLEMLFTQKQQLEKLEKIRSNTSALVWWLIAIPFIVAVLIGVMGV